MAWHRVALVAALACLVGDTRAQVCPDGQFSVSVLDDPQIQCLASRPCSGVYGYEALLVGVGACPSGTGCALLPHNPSVMGCVIAGRADVSYVNADGSLSKNGIVVAGAPSAPAPAPANPATPTASEAGEHGNANQNTNNNNGGSANNGNGGNGANNSNNNSNGGVNGSNNGASTNGGVGANSNGGNGTVPAATSPSPTPTNVPTPAHVKPGDIPSDSPAPSAPSPTSSSPASSAKPSSSDASGSSDHSITTAPPTTVPPSNPSANQQQALDNLDGDISNRNSSKTGGAGLGSIIAIVVGCLAVVAVVAGVFVLRKNKEQTLETPAPGGAAFDDYMGAAVTGVTPKENVLLL